MQHTRFKKRSASKTGVSCGLSTGSNEKYESHPNRTYNIGWDWIGLVALFLPNVRASMQASLLKSFGRCQQVKYRYTQSQRLGKSHMKSQKEKSSNSSDWINHPGSTNSMCKPQSSGYAATDIQQL
eukprot:gnl/TRDRNA2_/TRDRNA2_185240_c0_seq1.p1 gnl/TRDRNA2_/TRDRNA2_185240_c0~~gnl/TRDRNA2_/TRDRNA2_185240_c0_seq1.p1  ORF type:complete len:126 (-),score=5.32 gnl/TRDRNA2_/TRDRNA2_185240_c0_seq1:3-380(-)